MNVTEEILQHHITYGSSDNTNPKGLSASRSLNYANGASIQKPIIEKTRRIPYTFKFQDTVGLFGVENCFVRIDCDITDSTLFEAGGSELEGSYLSLRWQNGDFPTSDLYEQAEYEGWPFPPNAPVGPARISGELARYYDPIMSVSLKNLKTGNKYVDSWLDIRLYTDKREEHPFDLMYVKPKSFFYVGFHARNTRRLPYNVECTIGARFTSVDLLTAAEKQLIMR